MFFLSSYSILKFGSMSKGISMRKQHRRVLMYYYCLRFNFDRMKEKKTQTAENKRKNIQFHFLYAK